MGTNCLKRKWIVLFVAFFGNVCSVGLIPNMSVLYAEWLEAFEGSAAKTALVQSICSGTASFSGVIHGMLLSRFGVRIIGIVSCILEAIGFILSFFAPNLFYLILVFSVPAGLGASGLFLASVTVVQQYFDGKQKHVSLSIASLGSGVGGTVFTYALNYFSLRYGWRGCMLIVGGILLHCIPLLALCRPIRKSNSIDTNTRSLSREGKDNTSEQTHRSTNLFNDLKQITTTKLFLINLVGVIVLQAIAAPLIILIDFLQEKGFSREEAVLSYMVITICGTVSRLAPALLKLIPHMSIFGIALLISSLRTVTFFALPSVDSFSWNIVAMVCIGSCYGAAVGGILPISVSKIVTQQHFSQALGIAMTGFGIVMVIVGPFLGYLRDVTGSYDAVFYAIGSSECLGVVMYIIALGFRKEVNNQPKTTNSNDRKPSEEKKESTSNAYDNLSFETYL